MAKQKVEIEVDVPDGFKTTGEFRCAAIGDLYIAWPGRAAQWGMSTPSPAEVVILRKIEPVRETRWRNVYPLHITNPCAAYYETRKLAVAAQLGEPGKRVERIDYENGTPVSVTLEPAGGGES